MAVTSIKAIVFDIGGVLLRTECNSYRQKLEEKYNLPPGELESLVFGSEEAQASTIGLADQDSIWNAVAAKLLLSKKALADFIRLFWAGDLLDAELIAFLQDCRPAYITALLSNAWKGLRQTIADEYGIIEGVTVDRILFSSELGIAKPDPRIYKILANTINCGYHEILFVDDFIENVAAARVLGINTIHYQSGIDLLNEIESFLNK